MTGSSLAALPQNQNKARENFPALSGLRFVLIMIIVYYHGWPLFGGASPGAVERLLRQFGGGVGNQTFFMLSGFLMTCHYKQRIVDKKAEFPSYFFKRVQKLYPLYFCSCFVGMLLNLYFKNYSVLNFKNILLNFAMMSTGWIEDVVRFNSPLWFICVLLLCYVVFFVVCASSRKNRNVFVYASFFLVLWGYVLILKNWNFPFCSHWLGEGLHSFFLGCLFFELRKKLSEFARKIMAIIFCLLTLLFLIQGHFHGYLAMVGDGYLICSLLFAPALILCCTEFSFSVKVLGNRVFVWVSALSMSIFAWHMPLFDFLYWGKYQYGNFFNQSSPLLRMLLFMIALFGISVISYYLIEKKLSALLKKIFEKKAECNLEKIQGETENEH